MNSKVTRELGYFAFPCRCSAATRGTISKLGKRELSTPATAAASPRSLCGRCLARPHAGSSSTLLVLNLVINEADYFVLVLPGTEIEAVK